MRFPVRWIALLCCGISAVLGSAQLRIVSYNITNYDGTNRTADLQTVLYGCYLGRCLNADVILAQEFMTPSAVNTFRNLLNSAPGSPGDWQSTGFAVGGDTAQVSFYRSSRVQFLLRTTVSPGNPGGDSTSHPRNLMRFDYRPAGYTGSATTLACYNTHMKAGSTAVDRARRLAEAQAARANATSLNPAWHFLIAGDFNIPTSSEAAYVELVGPQVDDSGRFFDPIATPGNWNNNFAFRFVHTQDPIGPGGMDDRFDQILVSASLLDGDGFDYIGQPGTPYSTTTWDDPLHSYRAWGNDGTSFDTTLRVIGNTMVGPVIAQALINAAAGQGHLPVYLDLRLPPKISSEVSLDFGSVPVGAMASQTLHVSHAGDVALWTTAGLADLRYSLNAPEGFSAPVGLFTTAAGGQMAHEIQLDTTTPGPRMGTLIITSNAPEQPARLVTLIGEVLPPVIPGDMNCDGTVDFDDIAGFVVALVGQTAYETQYPDCFWLAGDVDGNGAVDFDDIRTFVGCLVAGGCG